MNYSGDYAKKKNQKNSTTFSNDFFDALGRSGYYEQQNKSHSVAVKAAEKEVTAYQEALSKLNDKDLDEFWNTGFVTLNPGENPFNDYDAPWIVKPIISVVDAFGSVAQGFTSSIEGVSDAILYGVSIGQDLFGYDQEAKNTRNAAQKSLTGDMFGGLNDAVRDNSYLGNTARGILQGVGQVGSVMFTGGLGSAAGLGTLGQTVLTSGMMGLSSFGSNTSDALNSGATPSQAYQYGGIAAVADMATEMMFGGLGKGFNAIGFSKGLSSADDMLAKTITKRLKNQIAKNFVQYGIKAGAEGFEELAAGFLQALAKKATYLSEEDLRKIIADEKLLDQFIVGAFTSGVMQSGYIPGTQQGSLREANKIGRDFISGLTQNEQAVIDKVYKVRLAETEKNGALSKKDKSKLYDSVVQAMEEGDLDINTIESVLGGEDYKTYKTFVETEDALKKEYDTLRRLRSGDMTDIQNERLAELKGLNLSDTTKRDSMRASLAGKINRSLQKDFKLQESYNEIARRGQAFNADLSQYTGKQRAAVERAINSGVLNNTNKSRKLVNLLSKIEADKGIVFDYANNAKLKELGFALEGKMINGITKDGMVMLNVQSPKVWQSTVGHEITHVLEGTEAYGALQKALFDYAKSKGEFESKRKALEDLYEGLDADLDAELTADLVGEYLFSDPDFIRNLAQNRNLFQRIYDEIKYLCKVATGKQLTELEKVKREFDKAWKEVEKEQGNTSIKSGVKYSLRTSEDIQAGRSTADFIESIASMLDQSKISKRKFKIGDVSEVHKATIEKLMQEINPNFSADDYELWIDGTSADHINIRHGENGEADHSMATREDKELIPWVTNTPDGGEFIRDESGKLKLSTRYFNADGSRAPQIRLHKEIDGNTVYVSECVPDSKNKRIYITSAYKKSSTDQLLNIDSNKSPQPTPEASFDNNATKNSIRNSNEEVNGKFSLSTENEGGQPSAGTSMNELYYDPELGPVRKDEYLDDISQYVEPYEEHQKNNWKNSKKIVIYESREQLRNFVEDAKERKNAGKKLYFGKVRSDIAERVKNELSYDIEGYNCALYSDNIKKIFKDHGNEQHEADRGQRAIETEDFFAIPEVVSTPEAIIAAGEYKGQPVLHFKKNGITVVGVIAEGVLDLYPQTMYISKKNRSLASVTDERAPVYTPETARSTASNNIIPQSRKKATKIFTEDNVSTNETMSEVSLDKDSFVGKRAGALYEEVNNMKKGVRVSKELSYLLDSLDLSDANKADSYQSLRTALLNIQARPNQVVNARSSIEAVARKMLDSEYQDTIGRMNQPDDVSASVRTRIQNLQSEIANNKELRAQSNADYDSEIAEAQALYDSKKNKNSLEANKILRRIERLKRLKNQNDADYARRIGDLEGRIDRMSQPTYKRAMQRKQKQNEYSKLMERLAGDTSSWKDKKLGISYKVNTLRRNLRDVVRDETGKQDLAKADAIYDELQGKYNEHEAELKREDNRIKSSIVSLKMNHAEYAYAHMLGEFRHNPDTTLTQEMLDKFLEKNKGKIDTEKVDKAIDESRKIFDELIVRVNERLREQGMKEIPYRKGYFPHFTNPKQGIIAKLFNWKPVDSEIPTSIAGITETFNPERSYQSFNKERKSDITDYDLSKALDTYVHGALDWIYHIEDIQKRRAFENYIRYVHSDEGVKARIEAIQNNEEYDADEMQEQIDLVYAEANNPLNNFVTDLRAGTNTLASKKSSMDRALEEKTNRKVYSVLTNVNNRVNANMVVGSVSSALTNFIPIVQSWVEVSPKFSLRAMGDTIRAIVRDDGTIQKSTFLTNRFVEEEKLYQSGWDKAANKAAFLMNGIDNFASQTVWRSKYLQNISEGMSETAAIKNADQFAENVIAGRSRGNQPTIFDAKNPLVKLFTAFQLEVNNQYGYMFKDAPQDSKNKIQLAKGYTTMLVGAYLYNVIYSSLVGRDTAFDPIGIIKDFIDDLSDDDEEDDDDKVADAFLNLGENILQEVPFVGGLLGGGRVPISSAIPYSGEYGGVERLVSDVSDGDWKNIQKELMKSLYYLAMPFGGGQLKKTTEGLGMFSDDFPIAGSYTNSGDLRFPVEDNLLSRLQAGVFGQYSSENAREYFDNGYAPLKKEQIQEFIDVDLPIKDYWEYREGLSKQETLEDKFDYIAGLDLPVDKKNILINNVVKRDEKIDLEDYEDFSGYEEFDFAIKNPGKYSLVKPLGGYSSYKKYTTELGDIKSDKDANGKTISGSRKKKVLEYINNLDADYGTKILLFKTEYPSEDKYNADIVEYLNDRNDLSYGEIVTILTSLGMTVTDDGTVSWD